METNAVSVKGNNNFIALLKIRSKDNYYSKMFHSVACFDKERLECKYVVTDGSE